MKRNILPIMATTLQALQGCVEDRVSVIYVDEGLYQAQTEKIRNLMDKQGYLPADIPLKRGRLFAAGIDWSVTQICDPLDIL